MRISTFVPAVLALTIFTATQAAPTVMKRGERANLEAMANVFVSAYTKVNAEVCATVKADVCADLDVTLHAKAEVLGNILTAKVDVEKIRVSTKVEAEVEAKAWVEAEANAVVIAPIAATVERIVREVCNLLERECIRENAHKIVVKVNAEINAKVSDLYAHLTAKLDQHLRVRAKVIIPEVCLNLGVAHAAVDGEIFLASNANVHVDAWVKAWLVLVAQVKVDALIKAL